MRDYRVGQIREMANVEVFPAGDMTAGQIRELGADHVVIATGARWRPDGMGRANLSPVPGADGSSVLTPDDIMAGKPPDGPVVIYDDDHCHMANVIAELLRGEGHEVTLATPVLCVAQWTQYSLEQERIERRMVDLGVEILARHRLSALGGGTVEMVESPTDVTVTRPGSVVSVTARLPRDELYGALTGDARALADAGIQSVRRTGDPRQPSAAIGIAVGTSTESGLRSHRDMTDKIEVGPTR